RDTPEPLFFPLSLHDALPILVHRDLKPANVMISGGGEEGRIEAKIIDFGLAKALNAPVDPMSLTRGDFVGTPAFASPEQFEHSRSEEHTSELQSLAYFVCRLL